MRPSRRRLLVIHNADAGTARRAVIEAVERVPVQIDGEPFGVTHVTVAMSRRKLQLIVP